MLHVLRLFGNQGIFWTIFNCDKHIYVNYLYILTRTWKWPPEGRNVVDFYRQFLSWKFLYRFLLMFTTWHNYSSSLYLLSISSNSFQPYIKESPL